MLVRRPVGPTATMLTWAVRPLCAPSSPRRRLSSEGLTRSRRCPDTAAGSVRRADMRRTALRAPTGDSVALASTLHPRSQLTIRASARRASTPARLARLTCSRGATSSGGGQEPGGSQPVPLGAVRLKRSTRLLLVSATYTSPLQSTAMAPGWDRSPVPMPRRPHFSRKWPSASNTCTRLFPLSSTNTLPAPSTATPAGSWKWPLAVPLMPHSPTTVPSAASLTTRLLLVSATYTYPAPFTATADGWLNSPGPLPDAPLPPPAPHLAISDPAGL